MWDGKLSTQSQQAPSDLLTQISTVPFEVDTSRSQGQLHRKGLGSPAAQSPGQECPVLCSQVIALTPEMTAVSLLLTCLSMPEWELPESMMVLP